MSEGAPLPSEEGLFTEELSPEEQSPQASILDPSLKKAAKRAAAAVRNARRGNDTIASDKVNVEVAIPITALATVFGGFTTGIATYTNNFGTAASAAAFVAYIGYKEIYRSIVQPGDRDRVQLPYTGYGLQCFKVRAQEAGCHKNDIAMVVIPRDYQDDERETTALACKRLVDVATVAGSAQPDKMIVPSSVLVAANARLIGNRPLKTTLEELVSNRTTADPSETALIIDTSDFIKLVESLSLASEGLQAQVMSALYRRYPHIQAFAEANDEAFEVLERSFRPLTGRAVSGVLPSTIMVREQEDGQSIKVRKSLPTPEITVKEDDVVVTQRDDNYQVLETISLVTMGQELKGDKALLQKLSLGREGYSDLQLLAIAADTLMQYKRQKESAKVADHKETSPIPLGKKGSFIKPVNTGKERMSETLRCTARIISAGTAAVAAAVALNPLLSVAPSPEVTAAPPPPVIAAQAVAPNEMSAIGFAAGQAGGKENPEWKVSPFNMDASGHYAADFNYRLDLNKDVWTNELPKDTNLFLPTSFVDPQQPRITLSRPLDGSAIYDLPYRYDTRIAAARIRTAAGEIKQVRLFMSKDGMTSFVPQEQRFGDWFEYDLVAESNIQAKPAALITTSDQLTYPQKLIKKADALPQVTTVNFREKYLYENSPKLNEISKQTTANGYMRALEKAGVCNCNICGTGAALVQHAAHPNEPLAYTTGFLNNDSGETLLYARHAWLTDRDGYPADPTPYRQSLPAGREPETSVATKKTALQQEWQQKTQRLIVPPPAAERPKQPAISSGLLIGAASTAAVAGLISVELQTGFATRALRRLRRKVMGFSFAQSVSDSEAYNLVNWSVYGQPAEDGHPGSKLPLLTEFADNPNPALLPNHVLQAVASKGIAIPDEYFSAQGIDPKTAQRKLRRAAKIIIEERS